MTAPVGEELPDDARTTGQLLAEQAILDPFSINEGERPSSFILSDTSSQCGKTPNSQAQPSDSNERVRRRETGEYCTPDDGLDPSSPGSTQGPTANPLDEGSTRQEAGSLIQKIPSAIIPSIAKGPTVNPLLCPVVGRMIPVCHGMYEPVLGLGPFELEHCSPILAIAAGSCPYLENLWCCAKATPSPENTELDILRLNTWYGVNCILAE